jgi:hypothetical protein
MRKSRFSDEQIIGILKEHQAGLRHHQAGRDDFQGSLAERAGFEPAIPLPVYTLSKRAPSTARPPLRVRADVSGGAGR